MTDMRLPIGWINAMYNIFWKLSTSWDSSNRPNVLRNVTSAIKICTAMHKMLQHDGHVYMYLD